MATDAEGGLWVCHWGGGRITRFLPDGRRDRIISLPAPQVTKCAFAGPKLDRLVITTAAIGLDRRAYPQAGDLLRIDPGIRGWTPPPVRLTPGTERASVSEAGAGTGGGAPARGTG